MDWNFYSEPKAPGWYAVLVCYDYQEGAFPTAGYWDGAKWKQKAVTAFGEMRDTEESAKRLAYEHDPDMDT